MSSLRMMLSRTRAGERVRFRTSIEEIATGPEARACAASAPGVSPDEVESRGDGGSSRGLRPLG